MVVLPFRLQYELSRRQRIRPHLRAWRTFIPAILVGMIAFVGLMILEPRRYLVLSWFLVVLFCLRGFFAGLIQIAFLRSQLLDVTIDEQGMTIAGDNFRKLVSWRKLWSVHKGSEGVWSVGFSNGVLVHVPAALLSVEQVEFLQLRLAEVRHGARPVERRQVPP